MPIFMVERNYAQKPPQREPTRRPTLDLPVPRLPELVGTRIGKFVV